MHFPTSSFVRAVIARAESTADGARAVTWRAVAAPGGDVGPSPHAFVSQRTAPLGRGGGSGWGTHALCWGGEQRAAHLRDAFKHCALVCRGPLWIAATGIEAFLRVSALYTAGAAIGGSGVPLSVFLAAAMALGGVALSRPWAAARGGGGGARGKLFAALTQKQVCVCVCVCMCVCVCVCVCV